VSEFRIFSIWFVIGAFAFTIIIWLATPNSPLSFDGLMRAYAYAANIGFVAVAALGRKRS